MIFKLLKGLPAWLAATLAVVLMAGAAQAAADTQPIEGTWSFSGGQVNVVPGATPGTYVGTVVVATKFAAAETCSHPAGDTIWQITGSGDSYTGTHEWLNPYKKCTTAGLADNGLGDATWTINTSGTTAVLQFCTAPPGDGQPGADNSKTVCFALSQTVSVTSEPAVPVDTAAPSIFGSAAVGNALSCSTGTWSNSPTGYSYAWARNGTAISGATTASYTVQSADVGTTLTCQVTAYNLGGAGQPATSAGVAVPVGNTPVVSSSGCPAATGSLTAAGIGRIRLGMTRAAARRAYASTTDRRTASTDLFCLSPRGLRVGIPTAEMLRTLTTRTQRTHAANAVAWATTANAHYSLRGVHPTMTLATARRHLRLRTAVHGRYGTWYLIGLGRSTGLVKVAGGTVDEVGIAGGAFTRTKAAERVLLQNLL